MNTEPRKTWLVGGPHDQCHHPVEPQMGDYPKLLRIRKPVNDGDQLVLEQALYEHRGMGVYSFIGIEGES